MDWTGKRKGKRNRKWIGWRLNCDMSFKIIYVLLTSLSQIVYQNYKFPFVCNNVICFTFGEHLFNACKMLGKFNTANWHTMNTKLHQSVCWFQLSISKNIFHLEPVTRHCWTFPAKVKLTESVSLGKKKKNH